MKSRVKGITGFQVIILTISLVFSIWMNLLGLIHHLNYSCRIPSVDPARPPESNDPDFNYAESRTIPISF